MYRTLKCAMLYVAKCCGFFGLARFYTANELRILCFHGLSLGDEHQFRPGLFTRPEVLWKRMKTLRDGRFPILSLDQGLDGLARGDLPKGATVVTFDDGFYSNFSHGLPILRHFDIPATIYVTSYYVAKARPIFRLVVQYLFWKSKRTKVDLNGLGLARDGSFGFSKDRDDEVVWQIIEYGEEHLDEDGRVQLSRELAARLDVSYDELVRNRSLSLMTPDEIRQTAQAGVSVQLHTHRHRLPIDEHAVGREIEENRAFLEATVGAPADHLCYPSGIWSEIQWPWLEAAGIRSAVTCERGLNATRAPRLGLKRLLDADDLPQIEFESEVYGFGEVLRRLFRRSQGKPARATAMVPDTVHQARQPAL
jgi:peptidoglycan/xylan/chitin deacetylase (PgdA/CDA1 family)